VLTRLGDPGAHDQGHTLASLTDRIVTRLAAQTGGAVLVTGFPEYLGGPAAHDPSNRGFKQRSELFVNGTEVANMSGNLIDAAALRAWHEQGVRVKARLGITTNQLDEQLLSELNGGLPESAVIGIGIERLLLTFFGLRNVRELQQAC